MEDQSPEKISNSVSIRSLKEDDLSAILPILETWIKDRSTGESLPNEVSSTIQAMKESTEGNTDRTYLVAVSEHGNVIGVVGLRPPNETMLSFTRSEKPTELINMYVSQEHRRGKGVGRSLVEAVEKQARNRGFTEIILNSGPRYQESGWGFYDKLDGFERVGVAEEMYGKGGDAPVWRKSV